MLDLSFYVQQTKFFCGCVLRNKIFIKWLQKKAGASKCDDTFILHNTCSKQIKRPEYISELQRYKTKCSQCKTIVQRVRSLLDEIRAIKENEVIGICEHCKRANITKSSCKRCDFIVTKFVSHHKKRCEERQERFKVWLCKVKHLLQAILDGESVCQHRVYKDTELERILRELRKPLSMREPDIDLFPNIDLDQLTSLKTLSESKDMLEELLSKIKFEGDKHLSSDDSLYPSPSNETCLCKYLKEGHFGEDISGIYKSKLTKETKLSRETSLDLSRLLSQEVYKSLIKRLVDLSKSLPHGLHQDLIEILDLAINRGLNTDVIKKLVSQLQELNKTLSYDISKDFNKEVVQGLINDLNDLLTLGKSQGLNKDLIQLLCDLSDLLTRELTNDLSKDQSELLSKRMQKDLSQILPKSISLSREVTQGSVKGFRKELQEISPRSQIRDGTRVLPRDQSKDGTRGLSRDKSKDGTRRLPRDQSKDISRSLRRGQNIDGAHDLSKDKRQQDMPASFKRPSREQLSPKGVRKDITQDKSSKSHKEMRRISPQKDLKPASSTIGTKEIQSSKDTSNPLAQKLFHLHKALGGAALNKNLIQDLANDINKTLGQRSPDMIKKIIQELVDLCEPAVQGIPRNVNIKLIQGLINDASTALNKGLSKDQNKRTVQELLNDLNKALHSKSGQQLSKSSKQLMSKDISRDQSSGVTSKALRPESRDVSKRHLKDAEKDGGYKEGVTYGESATKPGKGYKTKPGDILDEYGEDTLKKHKTVKGSSSKKKTEMDRAEFASEDDAIKGKKGFKSKRAEYTEESEEDTVKKGLKSKGRIFKKKAAMDSSSEDELTEGKKGTKTKRGDSTRKGLSKSVEAMYKNLATLKKRDPKKLNTKEKRGSLSDEDDIKGKTALKSKRRAGSESDEDIPKKGLKPQRSGTKQRIDTDGTSKKTRLKFTGKRRFSFGDEDFSDTETSKRADTKKGKRKDKEKENITPKDEKKKEDKQKPKPSAEKIIKAKQVSEAVLQKMLKDNKLNAEKYKAFKKRQLAKQMEMERKRLREIARKTIHQKKKNITPAITPVVVSDTSILECKVQGVGDGDRNIMIRGQEIIHFSPRHYKIEEEDPQKPLLFKTTLKFTDDVVLRREPKYKEGVDYEAMFRDGVIRYKLSEREFIDKGWTMLPTKKIMRKMNIYKMEPTNPQNCWFERHKQDGELFYDSGCKLADIDPNGRGRLYYRNGTIALEYYNAQESNIGQRYVVYSSGEEMEGGRVTPRTILALFDILGNGVVYDHSGQVRLKYNQSEGLLVDPKLGPPGKWKWHTLNDPPVLQQVFVNTLLSERDPRLDKVPKPEKTQDATNMTKATHPDMLAIELENFVKEKATKLLQKYKPFQIRMKAVKLNEQFSLKILDQSNIYLLFRDGVTSLKLNLGLLLISSEIIDTDTADMAEVATPYDKHPAVSHSVENIQKMLKTVRRKKRPLSERTGKVSI